MGLSRESRRARIATASEADGFTLIELLIVIVVLGILAAVVVLALGSVTANAQVAACNADAKTITTAVQAYDAGTAPVDIQVEVTSGPGAITIGNPASYYGPGTQASLLVTNNYLNAWPTASDFALGLSTTNAGHVVVYIPPNVNPAGLPPVPGSITDYDAETPTTGCNHLAQLS